VPPSVRASRPAVTPVDRLRPGAPANYAAHHRRILAELTEPGTRAQGFTLCVVTQCVGSTYRKAGALAVVRADGSRVGVISGGCLESDLERVAGAAFTDQVPRVVTLDTRSDDDLVFGSGSGCRGRMQVLFVPVAAGHAHPLCEALLRADREHLTLKAGIVTTAPAIGSGFVWAAGVETELPPGCEPARFLKDRPPGDYPLGDGLIGVVLHVSPTPRVLLIGAGPEAPPLIDIAMRLGWRVTIADHREALLQAHGALADSIALARPAAALAALGDAPFDACIVMTHSASNDREALNALAARPVPFIGLLGPPARRDELLAELDAATRASVSSRLHAPVGIHLGGHGPEMLALSIVAGLQRFMAGNTERGSPP